MLLKSIWNSVNGIQDGIVLTQLQRSRREVLGARDCRLETRTDQRQEKKKKKKEK